MTNDTTIHFILTGGTIDFYYEPTKDAIVPLKHSSIPAFIRSVRLHGKNVFSEVCMKDSRSLNEKDREKIKQTIDKSQHKLFLITHGTFTMPATAKYLTANLKKNDKTIILTGSMVPLAFPQSDAQFNLGFSMAMLKNLRPGVYICMNGKVFTPEKVAKSLPKAMFI